MILIKRINCQNICRKCFNFFYFLTKIKFMHIFTKIFVWNSSNFSQFLNITCVVLRLPCTIQGVINRTILKILKGLSLEYLFFLTQSIWYHNYEYRTIHSLCTKCSLNTFNILMKYFVSITMHVLFLENKV